jgi:MarR family transcriptional regulator, organic hydroperoxide resistance regulator
MAARRELTTDRSDAPEGQDLGAVLEFLRLLWAIDHRLQSVSKRLAREYGITSPQRLALRIVGRYPGIASGRLAAILHLHPSTVSGILKRLEARGYVERRGDPSDARRALFVLTARGRKLDTAKTGPIEAAVRRVLARSSGSTLAAAQEVLTEIAGELEREVGG